MTGQIEGVKLFVDLLAASHRVAAVQGVLRAAVENIIFSFSGFKYVIDRGITYEEMINDEWI